MFQSCLLILSAVVVAAAPPPEDWETVARLNPGAKIEIRKADKTKLHGVFEIASADDVTMRLKGGKEKVGRGTVTEVKVRAGRSRVKHLLIGAGIAAGAMLVLAAITLASIGGLDSEDAPLAVAGFGATGALIGAAAGAAWPVKWRTVYRAK